MTDTLLERVEAWSGESVVVSHDAPTGTWIFIALHDTSLGPATGGTRMKAYPAPLDALIDAQRLAEGMTYKWAGVRIPFGGGKAVLALPGPLDEPARNGLLDRYGRLLASLHGSFRTGVDLGTTPEDMVRVDLGAGTVMGVADGHSEDPGPYTALGVFVGIQAAVEHVFGSDSLEGRSVLIQGVGDVGIPLAGLLVDAGATLEVSDIDADAAERVASRYGARIVEPERALERRVDVYAPCAVGATVNPETIPRLGCRIVAGSANNQLLTEGDAGALHERGILYAPDYIINAGGALAFARLHEGQRDREAVREDIRHIRDTLEAVFREAAAADESPLHAARRLAERYLEEARRPAA